MPMIAILTDVVPKDISWLYVSGCVLVPFVWGLIVEFSFRWFVGRRKPADPNQHSAEYYQI